jgi:hypothetical protein
VQLDERLSDKVERDSLRQALLIAEEFAVALADQSFRTEAKQVSGRRDIKPGSRFSDMQDRARKLQEHLEVIFFGKELGPVSKRYLSF